MLSSLDKSDSSEIPNLIIIIIIIIICRIPRRAINSGPNIIDFVIISPYLVRIATFNTTVEPTSASIYAFITVRLGITRVIFYDDDDADIILCILFFSRRSVDSAFRGVRPSSPSNTRRQTSTRGLICGLRTSGKYNII